MTDWSELLLGAALAFYGLGVGLSALVLFTRRRGLVALIPAATLAGFVIHFAGLVMRGLRHGPLDNLQGILFLIAWTAVSINLMAHFRFRMEIVGIVILPLVVLLMVATLLLPPSGAVGPEPHGGVTAAVRAIHVIPAVLGIAALFLTCAASIVYLAQERALKSHRPIKFLLGLPSLETCERLGHHSLLWGFSLLTFVVATGVVSAGFRADGDWGWLVREKWSLLAWLIFAVVIYDRIFTGGWRGRKAAYLCLVGFGVMILRMVGA